MQISFAAERYAKNPRVENAGIQSPDCETRRNAPGLPDSVFAQDLPDTGQPLRDHAVVAQVGTVVAVDGSLGVPAEEPFAVEEVDVVVLLRQPPHHPVRGVDPLAVEFRGLLIEVACGGPAGLDPAAVGGEKHGHAGRVAAVVADGGVVETVARRVDPVIGVHLHRAGAADDGQRRGVDVLLRRCGVKHQQPGCNE